MEDTEALIVSSKLERQCWQIFTSFNPTKVLCCTKTLSVTILHPHWSPVSPDNDKMSVRGHVAIRPCALTLTHFMLEQCIISHTLWSSGHVSKIPTGILCHSWVMYQSDHTSFLGYVSIRFHGSFRGHVSNMDNVLFWGSYIVRGHVSLRGHGQGAWPCGLGAQLHGQRSWLGVMVRGHGHG